MMACQDAMTSYKLCLGTACHRSLNSAVYINLIQSLAESLGLVMIPWQCDIASLSDLGTVSASVVRHLAPLYSACLLNSTCRLSPAGFGILNCSQVLDAEQFSTSHRIDRVFLLNESIELLMETQYRGAGESKVQG